MDLPNTTTMIGAGAIFAGAIAGWNHVKNFFSYISSFIIIKISISEYNLKNFTHAYFDTKCRNLWSSNSYKYITLYDFVKSKNKNIQIIYEMNVNNLKFYNKIPLIVTHDTIYILRYTINPSKLIKDIEEFMNNFQDNYNTERNNFYIEKFNGTLTTSKNKSKNFQLDTDNVSVKGAVARDAEDEYLHILKHFKDPLSYKMDDIGQPKKSLEILSLNDNILKNIDEIKLWYKSKDWYKEKGLSHKRGLLIFGTPGNGKSSFAKALAMDLNIPIMIFDIANMSNSDFENSFSQVRSKTPCVLLIEDIDSVFDKRKNTVHEEGGLSFDCLLNSIDGVENSDSILLIITTNNIDKIDDALGKPRENSDISTRPGRIDKAILFSNPDENGRIKMANRILKEFPEYIDQIVKDGYNDSGAQFQERCTTLALKLYWQNKTIT